MSLHDKIHKDFTARLPMTKMRLKQGLDNYFAPTPLSRRKQKTIILRIQLCLQTSYYPNPTFCFEASPLDLPINDDVM